MRDKGMVLDMYGYEFLARYYDRLTVDVDYESFASFYEELFAEKRMHVSSIVDLACGTGTLTVLMAQRGYDMTGVDASAEMLMQADRKNGAILYLNQPLEALDLYGTYDAAICSLDGINHISPVSIGEIFRRVNLFLNPGGLFIFDIIPQEHFKKLDGELFIDEDEDIYCLWRVEFDSGENTCRYEFDIFIKKADGLYERTSEEFVEYAHGTEYLKNELSKAGFIQICEYGDRVISDPGKEEERIFFSCVKGQ